MRRSLGVLLVLLVPALSLSLACKQTGGGSSGATALGTFVVDGALQDNACAPGLETLDPLRFTVTLERFGTSATWRYGEGAPAGGTIAADGTFRFVVQTQVPAWEPDPDNGVIGCILTQTETVTGSLEMATASDAGVEEAADAGASDAGDAGTSATVVGFTAEQTIQIGVVAGTDCSPLLLSAGGSFPALPCSARYTLSGAREGLTAESR